MPSVMLTCDQIQELIPHRPPFLFLDHVLQLDGAKLVAGYRPCASRDWFAGHYPGDPVMPGVLLCESAFQAGAVLLAHRGHRAGPLTPVLTRIRDARFKRIVRPDELLRIEVELVEDLDDACYLLGRVFVGNDLVVRVDFAVMQTGQTATERRG